MGCLVFSRFVFSTRCNFLQMHSRNGRTDQLNSARALPKFTTFPPVPCGTHQHTTYIYIYVCLYHGCDAMFAHCLQFLLLWHLCLCWWIMHKGYAQLSLHCFCHRLCDHWWHNRMSFVVTGYGRSRKKRSGATTMGLKELQRNASMQLTKLAAATHTHTLNNAIACNNSNRTSNRFLPSIFV